MPDNTQINAALKYAHQNSVVDNTKLSQNGQKLVEDIRDIIETARLMIQEKNEDELFQEFVWETSGTNWDGHGLGKDDVPLGKDKVMNDQELGVSFSLLLCSLM